MADQSDQIGRAKIIVDGDIKPLSDSLKNAEQQTTQSMGRMAESVDGMAKATGDKESGRPRAERSRCARPRADAPESWRRPRPTGHG